MRVCVHAQLCASMSRNSVCTVCVHVWCDSMSVRVCAICVSVCMGVCVCVCVASLVYACSICLSTRV